jgi:hypothetical protein
MLKDGDFTGHVVYGRNIKKGKHVGAIRLQVCEYLSKFKVNVYNIDDPVKTIFTMQIWELWHTRKEASPMRASSPPKTRQRKVSITADTVAERCMKHINILFNQSHGGLYGR